MTRQKASITTRRSWGRKGVRTETGAFGAETIRRATCPVHGRESAEFVGENDAGWVFRCGGWTKAEAAALLAKMPITIPLAGEPVMAGQWHYFTAAAG